MSIFSAPELESSLISYWISDSTSASYSTIYRVKGGGEIIRGKRLFSTFLSTGGDYSRDGYHLRKYGEKSCIELNQKAELSALAERFYSTIDF